MPIFSPKALNDVLAALRNTADNFYAKTPLVLSDEEFIAAFINPDHLPTLRQVQELFSGALTGGPKQTRLRGDGYEFHMSYGFALATPITVPPYIKYGPQHSCPQEVQNKIQFWMAERYRLGRAFGEAMNYLTSLNVACGDMAALRLVFPAIVSIMAQVSTDPDHRMVKKARELTDKTRYGRLPRLPPDTKARLAEISAIINMVIMAKDAPDPVYKRGDAVLTVYGAQSGIAEPFI